MEKKRGSGYSAALIYLFWESSALGRRRRRNPSGIAQANGPLERLFNYVGQSVSSGEWFNFIELNPPKRQRPY
jgi:hypothetical protein